MSIFCITGLAAGIAFFIYFISAYEKGKEKIQVATGKKPKPPAQRESVSPAQLSIGAFLP
jgi:hypothetical protein